MARHPVVITPLEEDLRQIGLLREQDDEEPAPEADPEGGYSEMGDEEPTDEPDKGVAEQSDDEEPAPEPDPEGGYTNEEEGDEDDEDDDEDKAVEAIGTLAGHFLAQHQAIGPKPSGAMEGKPKTSTRPVNESKAQRVRRLASGKIFGSAPKAAQEPTSRVSALLEEVSDIVGDIHRSRKEEKIKGFANIAVIADTLSERFSEWGMALSEGNLYRVGSLMKKLSEQSADMAVKLDTPPGEEEPEAEIDIDPDEPMGEMEAGDDAQVDELFKKFMAKLLDALQLYNDVTGKDEMDDTTGDEDLPGDEDDMPVGEMDDEPEPEGDEDDAAENDPELDADDDEEMPAESGDIPPGIKTSQTEPEGDDEEDDDDDPMGESDDGDEDDEDPPSPYGQGAEEAAIAEARKRLTTMKKKLTAQKKGKKVLKGGKGKGNLAPPFKKKGKAEAKKGKKR